MTQTLVASSYPQLRTQVRKAIRDGKRRAQRAVEREKVITSWQVGKLILTYNLENKSRAEHGAKVIQRLSKDLLISRSELYGMVEFARAYPIVPPAGQLPWTYHRALLGINDEKKRQAIAKRADKEAWNRERLRSEIRKLKTKHSAVIQAKAQIPTPKIGKPGYYKIIKATHGPYKGKRVVDLGFSNYHRPTTAALKKVKIGKPSELFTYQAYVTKVVDGDTFWAIIDLGFGFTTSQKLRLKNIDAPELPTRAGERAKRKLANALKRGQVLKPVPNHNILIKTTKSDKYDRYLADVFVGGEWVDIHF